MEIGKSILYKPPRFGHKITMGSLIAKLNSKKDIRAKGIFHPPKIHWLTNPHDSLYLHMDTTWACCQNALSRTESLNLGTLSKTGPSTSKAYRQQWRYEGYLLREMINPLLGYDDPYYDNHDPDADVDEE